MKQNNPSYLFGMYEPDTDSVIVNAINDTYTNSPLTISCEKCNSTIFLDTPDDIAYLYRLAQESPLLYAELACKPNGLQEYVNAMNWFISFVSGCIGIRLRTIRLSAEQLPAGRNILSTNL